MHAYPRPQFPRPRRLREPGPGHSPWPYRARLPHRPGHASSGDDNAATPAPPDHDGRWKDALQAYFGPCLALFWPPLHASIDWAHPPVFLDKELQVLAGARRRGRRHVDKLAQVHQIDGNPALLLVHVEVQGSPQASFAERMFVYHYRLRERYPDHELIQLAILTRGTTSHTPLQYRYAPHNGIFSALTYTLPVVNLQQWQARRAELERLAPNNPFALLILAELEAAARHPPDLGLQHKIRLMRQLYAHGYDIQDVQRLFVFIDGILSLPPELELQLAQNLELIEEHRNMDYAAIIEQGGIRKGMWKGRQEGLAEGIKEGLRQVLRSQLAHRFDPLPETADVKLAQAGTEDLQRWALQILRADTLDDVWR